MKKIQDEYKLPCVRVELKVSEGDSLYSTRKMTSPSEAVEVMKELLSRVDREYLVVVNLDQANRPINYNIVSIGGIASSLAPMNNIFKSAILSNASSIMLFHNHPSGDVTPSKEDFDVTEKIIRVGKLMDTPVLDHIIVGSGKQIYSIATENYGLFEKKVSYEAIDKILKNKETKDKVAEKPRRITHANH